MKKNRIILSTFLLITLVTFMSSCGSKNGSGSSGDAYSMIIGPDKGDFRGVTFNKTTYDEVSALEDESAISFPSEDHGMLSYRYDVKENESIEIYYYFENDICTGMSITFTTKDKAKKVETVDNLFNKLTDYFTKKIGEKQTVSEFINSWKLNNLSLSLSRVKDDKHDGQVNIIIN